MKVKAHVIFYGRVQGVFFRANTREKARELGVNGWVRNLSDGSVEAVFEGEKAPVTRLIEFCSSGIPHARVAKHHIEWLAAEGFTTFEIRYG